MHHRPVAFVLALVLLGSTAVAPVAAATGGQHAPGEPLTAVQGEDQILRTVSLSLTPADPGTVEAQLEFELPDQVVELTTGIPDQGTVTDATGFEPDGAGNYTWDGQTASPSVTLSLSANRTGAYHRALDATGPSTGLMFADTGDWALVSVPAASVWWTYEGRDRPTFRSQTVVEGEGVAGQRMAYLGPHSTTSRQIGDQRVRLVVPEAAAMAAEPTAVLDSLDAAGDSLPDSPVTDSVLIAAPTSVDWGPYGLAARTDAWVRADQPLADPGNVWLHELVHLRQDFETTTETRWIREAMPEYYAAQLTLDQGHVDFATFQNHLDRGTQSRYADTVLSRPETWASLANYVKGGLVYGALDYRVRQASDRQYAARQVFAAMNRHDGPVDQAFLDTQVQQYGGSDVTAEIRQYATTTDAPRPWSRAEHEQAFGTAPAFITTTVEESVRISGPYRMETVDAIPTLARGERVSIPVTVANEGGASGDYSIQLAADGHEVATASGTLAPGDADRVELPYTFDEPGTVDLTLDSTTWTVDVREPATPVVAALDPPAASVAVGEAVEISVAVSNPRGWPAAGTISPRVDGRESDPIEVLLGPGQTVERTVTVSFAEPGTHAIGVGNQTATIQVLAQTTQQPTGTTATSTPGFGFGPAVLALVAAGRVAVGRFE